ncbi:MAG: flagellar type III secretion system pore protein FliP [Planctomycetota bacterium]
MLGRRHLLLVPLIVAFFCAHASAQVNFGVPIESNPRRVATPEVQASDNSQPLAQLLDGLKSLGAEQTRTGYSQGFRETTTGDTSSNPAQNILSRKSLVGSLQALLMVSVLSLAPAILLMTTCYVRVVVVMGLLRQALGTGQLPPNQVVTSIAIFITLFVMAPVWNRVYTDSIQPYTAEGSEMSAEQAWQAGVQPIREFMFQQIFAAGNQDDIYLFYSYHNGESTVEYEDDVPLHVLLPAFMLSELKTAFLMGFMIFMPFLIIDLIVASVTISMGMMMLPPAMISLPFKLLLFVLVDGWHLVVVMLLKSFGTIT